MKLVNTYLFSIKRLFILSVIIVVYPSAAQTWTLKNCIDTAIVRNKTLKIAQGDINIANQKNKEAVAGLLPKLYGNADYRYYTDLPYQLLPASVFNGPPGVYKEAQFGVPHNLNANLTVEMPLYNPQTFGAIDVTKKGKEINHLQFRQNEEQMIFEITNLYYNAQLITYQIKFINNSITNAEKLLSTVELLHSQQMVKGTDVDKIKLQQSQLNTQFTKANAQYQQILNLLKLQIGIESSRTITINSDFNETQEENKYDNQPSTELLLSNTRQLFLQSELKTLKLSHLPSLSLYGSYGTTGFANYSGVKEFSKFYPIGFAGLKLSWLIFSGMTLERKIIQKREEIKQNTFRINLLKEKQTIQTENAQLQYGVSVSNLTNSKSQLKLAETIYSKTLIQQKEGIATITDVLLADNVQKEAQQNYLAALVDVMKADLELKKITGNILNNK